MDKVVNEVTTCTIGIYRFYRKVGLNIGKRTKIQ